MKAPEVAWMSSSKISCATVLALLLANVVQSQHGRQSWRCPRSECRAEVPTGQQPSHVAGHKSSCNSLWLTYNVLELLRAWGQVQSGYVSPALTYCCAWASGASMVLGPVLHFVTLTIWSACPFGPFWSLFVLIHPSEATLQGSVTA